MKGFASLLVLVMQGLLVQPRADSNVAKIFIEVNARLGNNVTKTLVSSDPNLRLTARANLTCTIGCGVIYKSLPNITLSFDKKKLKVLSHVTVMSNSTLKVIQASTIKLIPAYHKGFLICLVQGTQFTEKRILHFNVLFPPEVGFITKPTSVVQDDQTELQCDVIGNPSPTIAWFKWSESAMDWIPLGMGKTFKITNINKLHRGRYKCVAENSLGTSIRHTFLEVKGAASHTIMLWIFLIVLMLMLVVAAANCIPRLKKPTERKITGDLSVISGNFDYGNLMNRRMSFFLAVHRDGHFIRPLCYQNHKTPQWQQQAQRQERRSPENEFLSAMETHI